jgi:flagellar biosynthetic protein FliO
MKFPRPVVFSRPVRPLDFFLVFFQALRTGAKFLGFAAGFAADDLLADDHRTALAAPPFPDAGMSLLRVTGALALVLGLFLGGVWLFKNWQRLAAQRGRQPRLSILESRSLGARQAVFVVAYEQQRFLVAASPAGVSLLSHLPETDPDRADPLPPAAGRMPFGQALAQVLKRK